MVGEKNINNRSAWFLRSAKILYFLLPLPVAWLSISLMSAHMKYYDIGINPGANNGFILIFVLPILLVILCLVAATALYLSRRIFSSPWAGIIYGAILIFSIGIGAFLAHASWYADYPTERPKDMKAFMRYFLGM